MGMDSVELVMAWEESFGIAIADSDAGRLTTPGMAIDLIHEMLNAPDFKGVCKGWPREKVRNIVRKDIREQLGLDDTFSDDAHFIHDLGID